MPKTGADEFEAFVRRYEDMVYATAVRLLGNQAEAEDVAQTVFLKAFERFDMLSASPSVGGWLKTVATNLSLNHLSRYRRRWRLFSEMGADDQAEPAVETVRSLAASVVDDLERAENAARLERALAELPDHQRVPLVLFHFDGRTYEQIAITLRVSLAKLKTDMHRGRLALRRHLVPADGSR
jgi:RNA polymerase sigma-70 factor (ECF subfamily)